ncbi:hypothetical protein NEDG_00004 [Nematocida displodere]|uniref:Uncharacterized protein n=1 Tax=Nematocida displodere TaxID=1805483 RepID=A0A177EKL5_9MICR|nr:hypothetical protein NEDG_00004 [Nematocida displodere]
MVHIQPTVRTLAILIAGFATSWGLLNTLGSRTSPENNIAMVEGVNIAEQPANMAVPPEQLARTDYTDNTIAFFEKYSAGDLVTRNEFPHIQINRYQPNTISIHLERVALVDIPEKLEPDLELSMLSIAGSSEQKDIPNIRILLEKIICALRRVWIEELHLTAIYMDQETTSPIGLHTPLCLFKALDMSHISGPFLEWFCEVVDLGGCTEGIEVNVVGCNTPSIACLNKLGISSISNLNISFLQNLQHFDYCLPNSAADTCELKICNLPRNIGVSAVVAKSLAEGIWLNVEMDMDIWNIICSAAKRKIGVLEELTLNIVFLEDLQADIDPGVRRWLELQAGSIIFWDCTKEKMLKRPFFDAVVAWVRVNASGVMDIEITGINITTDPELESLWARTPVDVTGLSNLTTLEVLGVDVPISTNANPNNPNNFN